MDCSSQVKSFTSRTLRTKRRYSLHSKTADVAFGCEICKVGSVSRCSRNSKGKSMICAGGIVDTVGIVDRVGTLGERACL